MGKKKGTPKKGARKGGPIDLNNISWGTAPDKQEPFCTGEKVVFSLIGLLFFMMAGLFFLVEDAIPPQAAQPEPEPEPVKPERQPYVFQYIFSPEVESEQVQKLVADQTDEENAVEALIVLVLEDSSQDPKTKLWKRWERIAKSINTKPLFQRYVEEELPKVVRVDCAKEANKQLCDPEVGVRQWVGSDTGAIYFKDGKPRRFGANVKSDKQLMAELFDRMQPAVRYIEEIDQIVDFTEDTENPIKVFLFGDDKDGTLEAAADSIRDWAKFGKNRKPNVATHFDIEDTPKLVMYRDFEPSPVEFGGDLTDKEAMAAFTIENQLPLFGEFSPKTAQRYYKMQYNRPGEFGMVALNIDPTEEESKAVMEAAEKIAKEKKDEFIVCYVDSVVGGQIGKSLGMEAQNQIVVVGKNISTPVKKDIDMENPTQSIMDAIAEYSEGDQDFGESDEYYDDEYDEDFYYDENDDGEGGDDGDLVDDAPDDEPAQKPAARVSSDKDEM